MSLYNSERMLSLGYTSHATKKEKQHCTENIALCVCVFPNTCVHVIKSGEAHKEYGSHAHCYMFYISLQSCDLFDN